MLSLVYAALFLAAGSNASPCKPSTSATTSAAASASSSAVAGPGGAATPAGGASPKAAEAVQGASNNLISLGTPSNGSSSGGLVLPPLYSQTASASVSAPSGAASVAPASGGGSCPAGFINTVFNTNAGKNGGWPGTTWSSMSSNGVGNWIGFSLGTLDTKSTYGNPPVNAALNAAQIHVVMDSDDTNAAITLVQSDSAPAYLELFNEPDFSFDGLTKTMDPIPAAQNLSALLSAPHPKTTFISPALMDAESDWLPTFAANCNGHFDQIPIIAMHIYNPSVSGVMGHITNLHSTWPDKKIWITELSPATSGCTMDANGIAQFMNQLFPQIIALGYVEKIFWNSGEWDATPINGAPSSCNPALTDANGNATPILTSLKNACGGSGSTATS